MKIASQDGGKTRRSHATEAVILFCIGNQTFAIAADAVQEIRSTDSLATAAVEIEQAEVPKVRHLVERGHRTYYVVSGCAHFGLRVTRPTLVLILRQIRAAVLVDSIERMAEDSQGVRAPGGVSRRRAALVSRAGVLGRSRDSGDQSRGISNAGGIRQAGYRLESGSRTH